MNCVVPRIASPPTIAGVEDRHCERVVKNMLAFLGAENKRLWAGAVGSLHTSQMGNPVGQQRAVERFRRTVGDLALDVRLKTGRRGHCDLTISSWIVWDAVAGDWVDPLSASPSPDVAWLAVLVARRSGLGGHDYTWNCAPRLLVTRHSCVRMAQRHGVRTVADLLAALRELWVAFEARADGCRQLQLADGSIAILEPDQSDESRWVVKTVLSARTLDPVRNESAR